MLNLGSRVVFPLLLSLVIVSSAHAAVVIVDHVGTSDPTTESPVWSVITSGTSTGSGGDDGQPHWEIAVSVSSYRQYTYAVTDAQIIDPDGWELTAILKAVHNVEPYNNDIMLQVDDSVNRWHFNFVTSGYSGEGLYHAKSGGPIQIKAMTDIDTAYHTYRFVFVRGSAGGTSNPGLNTDDTIEVYVDGVLEGTVGRSDVLGTSGNQDVRFGDNATSSTTSTGRWNFVEFKTIDRLYVDTTASGDGSGDSWANATTLTNALVNAIENTEIWIAEGTYTDAAEFEITKSLTLYGGFDGTEARLVDRALTGESIIDGQGTHGGFEVTSGDVLIDHLVITNGYRLRGGGIYATGHSSLELVDSRIDSCAMTQAADGYGGGAYVSGGTLTLTRATFGDNTGGPSAYYARGFGLYAINAAVQMTDCVFTNNAYSGGTNPNRGSRGGGFYIHGGTLAATNCTFAANKVSLQGGHAQPYSGGGAGTLTHSAVAEFTDCTFSENYAVRRAASSQLGGGTLRLYSSAAVTMEGCAITDSQSGDDGGAFYVESSGSSLHLRNCVIAGSSIDNTSEKGGGFFITGGSVSLTNCTVAYNASLDEGGAFYQSGGSLDLHNCILWSNTAPTRGADISILGGTANLNYNNLSGDPSTAATVYDGVAGLTEANSLMVDPLFVSATDFHLKSRGGHWTPGDVFIQDSVTSPCVDAGDPAADHSREPLPSGKQVNLGAYGNTPQASKTKASGSVIGVR